MLVFMAVHLDDIALVLVIYVLLVIRKHLTFSSCKFLQVESLNKMYPLAFNPGYLHKLLLLVSTLDIEEAMRLVK